MSDEPKYKPLLFSGPMVLAILAGKKTQTRRLSKDGKPCRLAVGDRIWVRETWAITCDKSGEWQCVVFRADGSARLVEVECDDTDAERWLGKPCKPHALPLSWRPSIFMPRWASRIELEVTQVREREPLHDMTQRELAREGFVGPGARVKFATLWEDLNGQKPGAAFLDNPPVDVISFKLSASSAPLR